MKLRSIHLIPLTALLSVSYSHAGISSFSEYGTAATEQVDTNALNPYFVEHSQFGDPISFHDPLLSNSYGPDTMSSRLDFTDTYTGTYSFVHMTGHYDGAASAHNELGGVTLARASGDDSLTFDTDSAAVVTVTASNASETQSGYVTSFSEIYVDGYYQYVPSNMTATINLGAGHHYLFYDASGEVYTGGSYGRDSSFAITSDYDVTIASPAPEPASLSMLGLGALALVRRRRATR